MIRCAAGLLVQCSYHQIPEVTVSRTCMKVFRIPSHIPVLHYFIYKNIAICDFGDVVIDDEGDEHNNLLFDDDSDAENIGESRDDEPKFMSREL